ncbi:hypothetical protein SB749_19175, partial [Brevibacterium sp. SIMBA_078]|uniref:hypothetical protein n=1 Tax=Brevibacterium sp. SIMBA_078 TaxID=3085816 RepID=UPI0039798D66
MEWEGKLNKLNLYKKKVKELRENGLLSAEKTVQAVENIKLLENDYIRTRSRVDILFFTYEFFSVDRNPEADG